MIITKEIKCQDCETVITLEFNGTEYKGYCPICDKEIIEDAFGDEQKIQDKYGR